ncbi:hypothetical protein DFQ26_001698 [Actinomortierella ambigua]|nr:hypothetical protein DFQ26_001698 [Actinomortierella ambigua]
MPPIAPVGYVLAGSRTELMPVIQDEPDINASSGTGAHASTEEEESSGSSGSDSDSDSEVRKKRRQAQESAKKGLASCPSGQMKVIEVEQPTGSYPPVRRVAITHFHGQWYAFINICPHQGSALAGGAMIDIEDMGIVWGAGVVCRLHGW